MSLLEVGPSSNHVGQPGYLYECVLGTIYGANFRVVALLHVSFKRAVGGEWLAILRLGVMVSAISRLAIPVGEHHGFLHIKTVKTTLNYR